MKSSITYLKAKKLSLLQIACHLIVYSFFLLLFFVTLTRPIQAQTPTSTPEPPSGCDPTVVVLFTNGQGVVRTTVESNVRSILASNVTTRSPIPITSGQEICLDAEPDFIANIHNENANEFVEYELWIGLDRQYTVDEPSYCFIAPILSNTSRCWIEIGTTFRIDPAAELLPTSTYTPSPVPTATVTRAATDIPTATNVPPTSVYRSSPTPTAPTATVTRAATAVPTATELPCPPPQVDFSSGADVIRWEPQWRTSFAPGERLTFSTYASLDACDFPVYWIINNEYIEVPPLTAPDPGSYPAPYPAPQANGTNTAFRTCGSGSYPCIEVSMPDTCVLAVAATFTSCLPQATSDIPTMEPAYLGQPAGAAAEPTEPQSIPEPLTVVLFGTGIAGLVGFAKSRRG